MVEFPIIKPIVRQIVYIKRSYWFFLLPKVFHSYNSNSYSNT